MKIQTQEELDNYLDQSKTKIINSKNINEIIKILKQRNEIIIKWVKEQFKNG